MYHSKKKDDGNIIFEGCPISLGTSMLLILAYSLKHSLTNEALDDLLFLIGLHLRRPCNFRHNRRSFTNHFNLSSTEGFKQYYYCKFCFTSIKPSKVSTCHKCNTYIAGNIGHHIHLPIDAQVKRLTQSKYYFQWCNCKSAAKVEYYRNALPERNIFLKRRRFKKAKGKFE